jgi:hypothetical protein
MIINGKPEIKDVKKRMENLLKKYFGYKLLDETSERLIFEVIHFGKNDKLDLIIDAFAYAFEELTFYVFATDNEYISEVRINF